MRISLPIRLPARRPPTLLEQLVGRQRARSIRRRLGLLALGAGVSLLKPREPWKPVALSTSIVLVVVFLVRW